MDERYSRQILVDGIGEEGQRRISEGRVLVVGLGGLGAPAATYLAGAGIGTLGLCDADTVSLSNLHRQILYTESEVGLLKAEQALWRLESQNPEVRYRIHTDGLTPDNATDIIGNYDLVVDCSDNFATRYMIDDACARCGVAWIYGAIGESYGQVSVMNHGERRRRFADLYPDRETMLAMPHGLQGAIGPVAGTIGSIQALEAIKILGGYGTPLSGQLLTIDLMTYETNIINI